MMQPPLLVVSDVDGTLLTSRERVTDRMRAVVRSMNHQGTVFTLASGRPARWLLPVLEQLPVRPVCVCANGAVVYDSSQDRITHTFAFSPDVLDQLVTSIRSAVPGVGFGAERAGEGERAVPDAGELFAVTDGYDHAWDSDEHTHVDMAGLVGSPAVKLLVRDPRLSSAELYEKLAPVIDPEVATATYSWEGGLVEVSAPGVSKRSALEWIAEDIGVEASEVVAFGDMPNDVEMLRWAGLGVAMGNAEDGVKSVADEVTADNNSDGVAQVLERWF